MNRMPLAQAKAKLSELVQRAAAGEPTEITVRGRAVAQISALPQAKKPIDFEALRRFTESQPMQTMEAGEFVRWMRDTDRF